MTTHGMRLGLFVAVLMASCHRQPAAPGAGAGGLPVREISVTSKGFEPARVEAPPAKPVILRFTRKAADTCADAVEVAGDPVRHMLPLDTTVDVKVVAPASGELAFACPMKMIHGAVVVVPQ